MKEKVLIYFKVNIKVVFDELISVDIRQLYLMYF